MILPYSKWVGLSLPTRQKIAQQFGIAKHRSTSVINNVVADDGYNVHDVENALTIEALQTFLHSKETDILFLFEHLVSVAEGRAVIEIVEVNVPVKSEDEEVKIKISKPRKVAKKAAAKKKK